MNKLQHTPWKWHINPVRGTDDKVLFYSICQTDKKDGAGEFDPPIATVGCNPYTQPKTLLKRTKANARLIAAAPEMLKFMINYYKKNINAFGSYDEKNLIDIIERATGKKIEEL